MSPQRRGIMPLIVAVIGVLFLQPPAIADPSRAGDKVDCYFYPSAPGCRDTSTKEVSHTTNSHHGRTIDIDYIKKHDPQLYARMRASTDECKQMAERHQQNTARYKQMCGNNAPPPQQVTEYIVREQFRTLPLPSATLQYQPTWGALVNKKEIFYTTAVRHHDYPLTLLGHRVVLHATVTSYTWSWGDGSAETTTNTPGAPYPSFAVTHIYTKPGTCKVAVTLTYTATYSVDGGPVQHINGTATIAGQPADVTVQTAHAVLVTGNH